MKNTIRCLLPSFVVLVCSATTGCAWLAGKIAESLAEAKTNEFTREVTINQGNGQEFLQCMGQTGTAKKLSMQVPEGITNYLKSSTITHLGFTKEDMKQENALQLEAELKAMVPTVQVATQVLTHPVHQQVMRILNITARPRGPSSDTIKIEFEENKVDEYMQLVEKVTTLHGWDALAFVADQHATKASTQEAQSFASGMKLIAAYMKAYFRAGQFASITLNDQKLKDALQSSLGIDNPDAIYQLLFGNLFTPGPGGNGLVYGSIGKVAFVTRGGDSYQFPAIQPMLNVTAARPIQMSKIDFIAVGSDLVRVFLEAILDAEFGVPGVTNSTGVLEKVLQDFKDLNQKPITDEQFGVVEQVSKGVEGGVSSVVGRVIRGAGLFSLNNESLASLIETFAGVALKKVSEKVCWCYFKTKNAKLPSGAPKPTTFTDTSPVTINIVVRGTVPMAFSRQ